MMKLLHQKILWPLQMALLFLTATASWGQSTITVSNLQAGTATYSGIPTGVSFSNVTKGSGVVNASAGDGLSGSGFNTASPEASYSANKYYTVTISAASGYNFTLTSLEWDTALSSSASGTKFTVKYRNNGGTVTNFGTASQGNVSSNTFTGSVTVTSGTSIQLFFIPSNANQATGTVRFKNGSTFTLTAAAAATLGTVTPSSLTNFGNTAVGSPTDSQTFTVGNGSGISGNITATAPSNFQVSLDDSSFSGSVSFSNPTSGNTRTVYVRFNPSSAGAKSGNVTISASGAPNKTVAVSGTGGIAPAINSPLTANSVYGDSSTYTITVSTGTTPVTYSADLAALPEGTSFDGNTISFSASFPPGTYDIPVTAQNAFGTDTETLVYTRAQKTLTVINAVAEDKVYDGTANAVVTGATLSGGVGSDDVSLNPGYTASFDNETVGTDKPVAATFTLEGTTAGRYLLSQPQGLTANITAKELTIEGITINDKDYDASTVAAISGTPALAGLVEGDDVLLDSTGATAEFANIGPGAAIPVTVTGYVLTGADSGNYTLLQPQGLTATINETGLQDQTITFAPIDAVTYGDAPFAPGATASSGLTVTYTSSDESVAVASGSTVTIVGAGTATITASQEGNASYNPAVSVAQELVVNQKELTVADAAVTDKIYDGTTTAIVTGTLTGVVGGDDVTLNGTGTFASEDAGEGITVTTHYAIEGADVANYFLTQPGDLTGNIIPAQLTLAGAAAQNKAYDSTAAATVTGTLSGIVEGDIVTLNGTGTFAGAGVGTGIAVTSTATLGGDDAGNYTLVQPEGLTADITAAELTVNATAQGKVYDRTTDALITVTQINGVIGSDDVTVSGGGTFNDFNAGINKPVTASLILGGEDAGNYTLVQPTGLSADITQKDLTITGAQVTDKIYDGTTTATITGAVLNGLEAGDEDSVEAVAGTFAQADVANGIAVTAVVLSGSASGNYILTQPEGLTGNILPAGLTLTGAAAQNKIYDGTDAATITGTLAGIVSGDTVAFNGTGSFTSVDVAEGIEVTATITLNGGDAGNYYLTQPTGLTANITPKPLSVTASAEDKPYDGTTDAVVSGASLNPAEIIDGDTVTLVATGAGTFNNANVGTNKEVSAEFTLEGADAANYFVPTQIYLADITALELTVDISGAAVIAKTYNGNTNAAITGAVLTGVLDGDDVSASTGTFASANAGTAISVSVNLSGAEAGNYTLIQPEPGLAGDITQAPLTATADNKSKNQGTANPALTISYSGFVNGETAATAAGFTAPTASTTATAGSPMGAYPIMLAGGSATNYEFIALNNGTLVINGSESTVFSNGTIWSNTIEGTDPGSSNPFTAGQSIPAGSYITVSGIGRGSGLDSNAGNDRYNTKGYGSSFNNSDYIYFRITVNSGYKLNLTNFSYNGQASSSGPGSFALRSSVDGYSANIGNPNEAGTTIGLTASTYQNLTGVIEFRFYGWGADTSTGTFSINNFSFNGSVLQLPPSPAVPSVSNNPLTYSTQFGNSGSFDVNATGTPTITFSANLEAVPGATINESTGVISFDGTTPVGTYNIPVTAQSYYGSDTETLVYTVTPAPALSATPATMEFEAIENQGPSAEQQITNITGTNLTPASGNITVAVTNGPFEVRLSPGAWTSSVSFPYSGSAVSQDNPLIYVRLTTGQAAGGYEGTVTISGGGASTAITLSAVVEVQPTITITNDPYGPFCATGTNNISVTYETGGTFDGGYFSLQHSDTTGIFPENNTDNIIGGFSNPLTGTIPSVAGTYRVRVIHNGTVTTYGEPSEDIIVNALPSLTGVSQAAPVCSGSNAQFNLTGLAANAQFTVSYTVNGGAVQQAVVASGAEGSGSFEALVTSADNGQSLTVTELVRTDITPNCTATVSATATIAIGANTWTGAEDTDWNNPANWSCGMVPTQETPAVIAVGDNIIEIAGGTSVYAQSLTVEDGGEIVVTSGNTLYVTEGITVSESGRVTLQNNANLIQLNDVDNTGSISSYRNSSPLYKLDYTMWSSPVAGQNLLDFSPNTVTSRFYTLNTTTNQFNVIDPETNNFSPGSGYLIRMPNNHPTAEEAPGGQLWEGVFTGVPNNGDVTLTLSGEGNRYNMVGNPYPSPISIQEFFSHPANQAALDGSIWIWRKTNGASSYYITLNSQGDYVSNGQPNALVEDNPQGIIRTGQGFLVKLDEAYTGGTADIAFTNDMRSDDTADNFFRMNGGNDDAGEAPGIWLNLTSESGFFSQMFTGYYEGATTGRDKGADSVFFGDNETVLAVMLDDKKHIINAYGLPFSDQDIVPLYFETATAGNYTIAIDHLRGLFTGNQDIFLKDNLLGITHDLKAGSYDFTTEPGEFPGRFEIVYVNNTLGTNNPAIDAGSIIVYRQDNALHITSGAADINGVAVYDIRGRLLYNADNINDDTTIVKGLQAAEQVLVVQVKTAKGTVSKKVVF